ncbi:MAG: redox-sensing transcriptional repressor Rex [Armatimonadota bacterium]
MNQTKRLSRASIFRLELYLEVIESLQREGREFVTSSEIGNATGITSVKVRQDLFGMGSDGRPKVGYELIHLIKMLREVFDLNHTKSACIVGYGNMGRALAGSNIWGKAGYDLAAIFDNDSSVISNNLEGVRVRNITELFGVVKTAGIQMAVLTVPAAAAQETADLLVSAGIKSIWNFTPVKLTVPDNIIVENQSLVWGLIALSFRAKSAQA